jgi:hypothetical protein
VALVFAIEQTYLGEAVQRVGASVRRASVPLGLYQRRLRPRFYSIWSKDYADRLVALQEIGEQFEAKFHRAMNSEELRLFNFAQKLLQEKANKAATG